MPLMIGDFRRYGKSASRGSMPIGMRPLQNRPAQQRSDAVR